MFKMTKMNDRFWSLLHNWFYVIIIGSAHVYMILLGLKCPVRP